MPEEDAPVPSVGPAVTVGGLPGTGTTTLSRILKDRLGVPHVYAGQIFREEARRRGLDLEAFGALCEKDPRVDRQLDARQVELLRRGGVVLEGRLSGWLAQRERLPALKVWVVCDDAERARRVAEREGGTPGEQWARMRRREQSEAQRYLRYYGIDLGDLAPYDLVLDSTHRLPADLADEVVSLARRPGTAGGPGGA